MVGEGEEKKRGWRFKFYNYIFILRPYSFFLFSCFIGCVLSLQRYFYRFSNYFWFNTVVCLIIIGLFFSVFSILLVFFIFPIYNLFTPISWFDGFSQRKSYNTERKTIFALNNDTNISQHFDGRVLKLTRMAAGEMSALSASLVVHMRGNRERKTREKSERKK